MSQFEQMKCFEHNYIYLSGSGKGCPFCESGMPKVPSVASALDVQVGGDHYRKRGIQPVEYIHANGLDFFEGCVVKYITRWRDKDGFKDLEKIKHYVDLLIDLEKRKGNADGKAPQ